MAKKFISGLAALFICLCMAAVLSQGVSAESQNVTIKADKSAATVTVTITDASLNDKEVSVVCYNPQWNGTYTDLSSTSSCIEYLGQVKVNNSAAFCFPISGQVASGSYSLVIGSSAGKSVTKFSFDKPEETKTATPAPTASAVPATTKLSAPAALKAVQSGASEVKLTWGSVAGAVSYSVYRSTKATTGYAKLGDVTAALYVDKKASAGKTYYYKVSANSAVAAQSSIESTSVSVSIMKAAAISVKSSKKKAVVSWKKISGVAGYKVYMSAKKNGKYKVKLTVKGAKKVKATIKKLKSGKKMFFKVRAYKKIDGKTVLGKFSKVKSIKIK